MLLTPGRLTNRRPGVAIPLVILFLPLLAAAFALAVTLSSNHHTQLELQVAADAAALAGTNAEAPSFLVEPLNANSPLVPDILLTDRADRLSVMLANAQQAADVYGQFNLVSGNGLILAANPTNNPNGELVFGTRDAQTAPFVPAVVSPLPTPDLYNPSFNAVIVQVQRSNVRAVSRTYLDRDVFGFKVNGSSDVLTSSSNPNIPAIPVVPVGILTDYTNATSNPNSWESNIIQRNGPDIYRASPGGGVVVNPDGIPEIQIRISGNLTDNGQLIAIGAPSNVNAVSDALGQITDGITGAQLSAYDPVNQQLSLFNASTGLNQQMLPQLTPQVSELATLEANMVKIIGQRRVWMLFDQVAPLGTGTQVSVVGFVAARVMNVSNETDGGGNVTTVIVTLQPTMLLTSTALTDRTKRQLGPRTVPQTQNPQDPTNKNSIFNPYIARVRLVN